MHDTYCKYAFYVYSSIDETNWDSPLNRLPETRTAYRILKHSFAVRGKVLEPKMYIIF